MKILVDTNLLTRSAQAGHAQHGVAVSALTLLTQRGETLCVVPQVIYEFWVVATRPVEAQNGLGLTFVEANAHLQDFAEAFTIEEDAGESAIRRNWNELVMKFQILGKSAHDARVVAAMNHYGIATVLTFNKTHFTRFHGIQVITPDSLSGVNG